MNGQCGCGRGAGPGQHRSDADYLLALAPPAPTPTPTRLIALATQRSRRSDLPLYKLPSIHYYRLFFKKKKANRRCALTLVPCERRWGELADYSIVALEGRGGAACCRDNSGARRILALGSFNHALATPLAQHKFHGCRASGGGRHGQPISCLNPTLGVPPTKPQKRETVSPNSRIQHRTRRCGPCLPCCVVDAYLLWRVIHTRDNHNKNKIKINRKQIETKSLPGTHDGMTRPKHAILK